MEVKVVKHAGLFVEYDDSTQHATIYTVDDPENPVGTMQRARAYDRTNGVAEWSIYKLDGSFVVGVSSRYIWSGLKDLSRVAR